MENDVNISEVKNGAKERAVDCGSKCVDNVKPTVVVSESEDEGSSLSLVQ